VYVGKRSRHPPTPLKIRGMMVKTYLLITTIVLLQLHYSLSLPEDGNEILLVERQKRQFRNFDLSTHLGSVRSYYPFRVRQIPKCTRNTEDDDNRMSITVCFDEFFFSKF
jgi:hypothetical protein